MDLGLRDTVCIVTGSTGGIGLATSKLLADNNGQFAFPVEIVVAWRDGNGLTIDCQS